MSKKQITVRRGSTLVGRQEELARLRVLLDGQAPLITLWGPGGAGKTSMIHHLRETQTRGAAYDAAGGVLFCDLTEARTEADILRSLAVVLSLERGDYLELSDNDALVEVLSQRPATLFLLDNLEQVAEHAHDTLERWIARCPQHRFVVTSREPLGLPDEARIEIGALPESDAVQLFARAARAVRPLDLRSARVRDIVRRIVNRLDRLPLAIELAAARLVLLDPDELLERLDRQLSVLGTHSRATAPHQRTLEETVRWSWDLLTEPEQRALALCSVFRGGFSCEAAEALVEPDEGPVGLDLLESLRMRSLVHPMEVSATRLRMYEAVREFATQRLEEVGLVADAEHRHAEVTLALVERRSGGLTPMLANTLDDLAAESENLLAIHERFLRRDTSLAARAALALHPLLLPRGPFETHTALLDALLSRRHTRTRAVSTRLPRLLEGRLHMARGEVLRVRGRLAESQTDLERARRLSHRCGDGPAELQAIRLLGSVARMQGRVPEALRSHRRALQRAREARDEAMTAICLGELGTTLAARGRLRDAATHHRMALDLHRSRRDRGLEGIQLSHLGVATHRLGDARSARRLHEAALAIHRELGNRRYEAADLSHLAFVHHQLGEIETGRQLYHEALALCRAVCDRRLEAIVQCYLADLETEAGEVVRARELLLEALGFHERAGDRPQQAVAWLHLGYNLEHGGQLDDALDALKDATSRASREQVWVRVSGHAHLAALMSRVDDELGAEQERGLALADQRKLENRYLRLAARLLGRGEAGRDRAGLAIEAGSRVSSDVRRALRWIQRGTSRELWVGKDASWFSVGQGRVDLSRRGPTRRILEALVAARLDRPGAGIPWHGLFEAGWPGQQIQPEAQLQRVYTAVWTLRRMGLEDVLLNRDDGYLLDSTLPIRRQTP